jgi:predicted small metal-binding protein
MRAVDCPCGEYLEGRNDSELLEATKQHADKEHEGTYSEADLRILVDTAAYDVGGDAAP